MERGRRVLVRDVVDHVLREVLAELDAPLVEGVDAPDEALDRAPVLVEREERADVVGVELREESPPMVSPPMVRPPSGWISVASTARRRPRSSDPLLGPAPRCLLMLP